MMKKLVDQSEVKPEKKEYESNSVRLLKEEISLQERKNRLIKGLPHLYGWKWYKWAREFFDSKNKLNFLCAANQISKSSTQIRKCIDWATDQTKWADLWSMKPNQFWYFYPSQEVVNAEFEMKWKSFLPRDEYETHPVYGWKVIKKGSDVIGIQFNSGVMLLYKTYSKKAQNLQSGSVFALFADEEMPVSLYDELINRLNATNGYFHMVFTATLGQDLWRRTMEPGKHEEEKFPLAFKRTVSLYDALFYEDGTRSHWTIDRIKEIEGNCKSPQEVAKRVYGRFVMDDGRTYPQFQSNRHVRKAEKIPDNWNYYGGVDPGSGGSAHPAAMCIVAVSPDYKQARVVRSWRGDGYDTSNADTCKKWIEIKNRSPKINITAQYYDWQSRDFFLVAQSMGETFLKADKTRDKGEALLNSLFNYDMLLIYEDEEGQNAKLAAELASLSIQAKGQNKKNHKVDDLIDALRYAISQVPFNFEGVVKPQKMETPEKPMTLMEREIEERRKAFEESGSEFQRIQEEFDEANEAYGW